MDEQLRILLVDDDDNVRKIIERLAKKEAYAFSYVASGDEVLDKIAQESPDLVILDVMLPEIDGFEICRSIRKTSAIPIIMLSAKGDIVDKSVGFNAGADDYVTKPFSPVELALRIKAIIRRMSALESGGQLSEAEGIVTFGDLTIDPMGFEVYVNGKNAELTSREFELLWFMASHPGQVFTREQLFDNAWGEKFLGDSGTITVFIRKIREKIEKNPSRPEYLLTVWGVGYKFSNVEKQNP
ncbi:MAG: response regulator transcription factor [Syntrophomonadaceae bacterium]|nr:response regulator transcription factor [Syntrophomonadaceae bacterium]